MAKHKGTLSLEDAREYLAYDPLSGFITWRKRPPQTAAVVGSRVGLLDYQGYRIIHLRGTRHKAHRVIWLMQTGQWPNGVIDHINTEKDDNRWSNLRDLPVQANSANQRRAHRDSKTGFLGVYPAGKKFGANIYYQRKIIVIGTKFDTPQEAHAAYVEKKRLLHPTSTL